MTPQRAHTLAGRWILASIGLFALMLILAFTGLHELNTPIAIVGGGICSLQIGQWLGWARGYEAAQRAHASTDPLTESLRCHLAHDVPDDVAVQALKTARAAHDQAFAHLIVKWAAHIIRTNSQPYRERPGMDGMMRP